MSENKRYSAVLIGPCRSDDDAAICVQLLKEAKLEFLGQANRVIYVNVPHPVVVGFTKVKFPNLNPKDRTPFSGEEQCRILIEIVNGLK